MSSQVESSSDNIELHFCQACGVSVPQSDVDSGRARCEPDSCAWRLHPERCPIDFGQRIVQAPVQAEQPAGSSGTRILTTLALLYVVGASTFLLFREVQRKEVVVDLQETARAADVLGLSAKLDQADHQMRGALADLKSNDNKHHGNTTELARRIDGLKSALADLATNARAKDDALAEAIIDVANRAGILKGTADATLREVRQLAESVEAGQRAKPGAVVDAAPKPDRPAKARKSAKQLEEERLMGEYILKLRDKKATEQTRYNAAVQLGDLRYEPALDALMQSLQADSHDLVRRAAAWSIGMHGKRAVRAIPILIAQIGGKHEYVGYMCERALGEITKAVYGEPVSYNFDPTMSRQQRKKVEKEWLNWWKRVKPKLLPGE